MQCQEFRFRSEEVVVKKGATYGVKNWGISEEKRHKLEGMKMKFLLRDQMA